LDTRHNPTHIFRCNKIAAELEPEMVHAQEASGYEWVPLARTLEMVFSGEIQDSFTVAGILAYHTHPSRSRSD